MSKEIQNMDDNTLDYLANGGKFNSQLTKEEKEALKKEQKEIENLEKEEKGFTI